VQWLQLSLRRDKNRAEQKSQVMLQYICGDTTHLRGIQATTALAPPSRDLLHEHRSCRSSPAYLNAYADTRTHAYVWWHAADRT